MIVAEDITSRFLNVISLFNRQIPLVAIQMSALKNGDNVGLVFTTVLDHIPRGEEDDDTAEPTDRAYWENRGSKKTVAMADQLLKIVKNFDPELELKFNKHYIGLSKNGQSTNFVTFRPKKGFICLEVRLPETSKLQERFEEQDFMPYDKRWGRYRIRLQPNDIEASEGVLRDIISEAYSNANQE